jgi:RimJ/RimL family protein N-acetyltransferase
VSKIEPHEITLKNGRQTIIRAAVETDAESLLRFFDAIVSEDKYNVTTMEDVEELQMTVEKEEQYIQDHQKQGNVVLVAEIDREVIGMAAVENGNRKRISHVGCLHINVLKPFRGNGIGTSMLKLIFEWASQDTVIEKIGLGVFSNNAGAINLYKKLGFVEEGRKVKEIKIGPDNYVDSILMYKFVK